MHTHDSVTTLDFRDPTKYTYNTDLVEFTEYAAQLKDLVSPNVALGCTFTNNIFANYGIQPGFDFDPVVSSGVAIQGEKLGLIGGQVSKQVVFPLVAKPSTFIPEATIKFNYYPNYSGNPDKTQKIFKLASDSYHENELSIIHSSTGDFLVRMYTQGILTESKLQMPIEVANEPIEILLSYKYGKPTTPETPTLPNTGEQEDVPVNEDDNTFFVHCSINGKQVGLNEFSAEMFDIDKLTSIQIGTLNNAYPSNFSINNLLITNQYTEPVETYTTGYTMVETRYSTDPLKIEPNNYIPVESLINVTVIDNSYWPDYYLHYTFKLDDVEYFFDRQDLTWKEKTEVDQVSDLSYMLKYKDQLDMSGTHLKVIPYLVSIAGKATPSITAMTVQYDEYVCCKETTPKALIYGYVKDVAGNPVRNAKVVVTPSKSAVAMQGNYILPKISQCIRTGVNGYWDVQLSLSTNFDPIITYNIEIIIKGEVVFKKANIEINTEGTIKIDEL